MEKKREFMCPVCMKETKKLGHLMGPECEKNYQNEVVSALKNHQTPVPELDYAESRVAKNLIFSQEQLKECKEKTSSQWDQAYEQIRQESHGVRLSKENFLRAVKTRFAEILKKDGMSETAELTDVLRERIYNIQQQLQWYDRIKLQQQERAGQEKITTT